MGFQTPQYKIETLLEWAGNGDLQLPDFQREYKWEDERIRQLLVTVLRGHPMGVIMMLQTGSDQVRFKPKPITGVVGAVGEPKYLLLDGQQRTTSMFQALSGAGIVDTQDDRGKKLQRRYFIDVTKALGTPADQDDAVISIPADGKVKANFNRDLVLDLSTTALQQRAGLIPFVELFQGNATGWLIGYANAVPEERAERFKTFERFNAEVLVKVSAYEVPAIQLDDTTTKDAVATVFEKVNTGGLPLNVFELLTSTFAGDAGYFDEHGTDFRLAEDWAVTETVMAQHAVLSGLQRTDFLQAVTLLTTHARHQSDVTSGKVRPAAISARRADILRLELADYLAWAGEIRSALSWVAGFLRSQHVHTPQFLPYRTQIVPLAVFRVLMGPDIDTHPVIARIRQWYWCGVLGESYGSATETRYARDVEQVPAWAWAGSSGTDVPAPVTVRDSGFRESRLHSLRTRGSAAYKGIYALLMSQQIKDWRYDKLIDHAAYGDLSIDIHHIFPTKYAETQGFAGGIQDSIVNKTPLAKRTNIALGGRSPQDYLPALEKTAGMTSGELDAILSGHLIDTAALRDANFDAFFRARREALVQLIESATGKAVARDVVVENGVEGGSEDENAFEQQGVNASPDEAQMGHAAASWAEALKGATAEEAELLSALEKADDMPIPELGSELGDGIPMLLSWPSLNLAVAPGDLDEEGRSSIESLGWTLIAAETTAILDAVRKARGSTLV